MGNERMHLHMIVDWNTSLEHVIVVCNRGFLGPAQIGNVSRRRSTAVSIVPDPRNDVWKANQ